MANLIERDFNMEDLVMLERAQVFHNAFEIDDVDFIPAFPFLAPPFAANFQTAIDTADAIPSGYEIDAQIAVVTEELNNILPLAQKAMQKLFTYVDVTWNSTVKLKAFGKSKYEKARNSALKMKELLEFAHRQAEVLTNKTPLLASGYTQADIDGLLTLCDAIDAKNAEQEDMLAGRGEQTQARVLALNTVWGFMQQINKASKVVFVDNPAKIELYLLYPTSYSSLGKVQNLDAVIDGGPPLKALVSWDFVTGGIDYEIERSAVPLGNPVGAFIPIVTVQNDNYADTIGGGQTYYYRVRAKNSTLTGAWSDVFRVDA